MILFNFLDFYYSNIPKKIQNLFLECLKVKEQNLVKKTVEVLSDINKLDVEQHLNFFSLLREIQNKYPSFSISFNNKLNICYDFFIEFFLELIPKSVLNDIFSITGASDFTGICLYLKKENVRKDFFREIIRNEISPSIIKDFYLISSILNFSSGGESTFMKYNAIINKKYENVLDAGCGSGLATCFLSQNSKVTSIDTSPIQLKKAMIIHSALKKNQNNYTDIIFNLMREELKNVNIKFNNLKNYSGNSIEPNFIKQDISTTIPNRNFYDFILCIDVLEHLQNPKEVLLNLMNSLNSNGKIALTIQTLGSLISQEIIEQSLNMLFPIMMHINSFNLFDLKEMIKYLNFRIEFIDYYNPNPFLDVILYLKRFEKNIKLKDNYRSIINSLERTNNSAINELKAKQIFIILHKK